MPTNLYWMAVFVALGCTAPHPDMRARQRATGMPELGGPQSSSEETAAVVFPSSFKEGVHLEGPVMAALEVAMNEFLPPGSELQTQDPDKRMAQCLSRRSTYDTHVLQSGADLFFVWFSPQPARCGLNEPILDGGAVYAIDGQGRILDRR
ncbi:putative lipoprotein [Corallococcus coralloides DSM 2259]|uniref:Putative lipoprotein n=1 Tax=Corallococcus coralloides (strain ATCC 25202 / DSM 2259 / NBRC 100086 / M2) TaxID=1144275 RepID=H8MLF8_CORCM|nr:hypothetical protein [Corallococcus coralloides]AFE03795.1 putative lipoprotein [Corallococcus coralloides DSM 2259]